MSFNNAIAEVCEASGSDVTTLADVLGHDVRIGRRGMQPFAWSSAERRTSHGKQTPQLAMRGPPLRRAGGLPQFPRRGVLWDLGGFPVPDGGCIGADPTELRRLIWCGRTSLLQ
ncbi:MULTISPECIES: hypothetical protein [unclassified Streptomyces]|uniref:hypothetical protein n=1 Tax=unclassified Streptomyces TaxID=2593676 RepID=UPI001C40B720